MSERRSETEAWSRYSERMHGDDAVSGMGSGLAAGRNGFSPPHKHRKA